MRLLAATFLLAMLLLSLALTGFQRETSLAESADDNLVVRGLVLRSLNLTYGEVESLPTVSEMVPLKCVYASEPQPFVWTGVPLFFLLNLSGVQSNVREVVFRGEDDFSSSLTLDKAMHPTTLLALKVNGTTLPLTDGYPGGLAGGYPYKVVVPCKQGYKWVGRIDEIELVDYDYKGTYESVGFSDEADIPNCTGPPTTEPPYTVLNATWYDTYSVTVCVNTTTTETTFNQTTKRIQFKITSDNSNRSLVYVMIPKGLITANFTVFSDGLPVQHSVIHSASNSFLFFTLNEGSHNVEIKGMLLADVTGPTEAVPDGAVNMLDLYVLARLFGITQSDPLYLPQYDLNSDGIINMLDLYTTARDYGKTVP